MLFLKKLKNMPKNLAKATLILTISEIIYNVASFVVHGAVGRILGPEDYGRYERQ
jgi:O-antigen/teichoic acid export membrane protein